MGRSPFLPDPERLQGLWTASGVEVSGEGQPPPRASGRIRFSLASAPPPPALAMPEPPAPPQLQFQREASPPSSPPAPASARPGAPAAPRAPSPSPAQRPPGVPPGVAVGVPAAPAAPALDPGVPVRVRPGPLAVPEEALAAQVFGGAPRAIDARLQKLLEFIGRSLSSSAAFVADEDGLTVASLRSNEALAAVTAPLGDVHDRISPFVPAAPEGSAVVELEGDQGVLQLVWAATAVGRLAMGMVLPAPLDRASTQKIRRLVQLAVDTKGSA